MAKFCENCGSPLQSDNKFCPNCGAPVKGAEAADTTKAASDIISPAGPEASAAMPGEAIVPPSAGTAVGATVAAAAAATEKAADAFVPPEPKQKPAPDAEQHPQEPPQPESKPAGQEAPPRQQDGPQEPGRSAFEQTERQEKPAEGQKPFGTRDRGETGPRYEPDKDLQSMFLRYDNRLNRKRYIMRCLMLWAAVTVITTLIGFVAGAVQVSAISKLGTVISIASIIPSFMLMIRRLHDLDRPTWWCVGAIIPVVNLVLAIYLLFFKGTDGPNQYGPDPLTVPD